MLRFYIYKLTFKSGSTYIGQHTQKLENDKYITSSTYYKRHLEEDPLISREIILDNIPDRETLNILETICICHDKAENSKNVNGTLGGWLTPNFAGWNKGIPHTLEQKQKISRGVRATGKSAYWLGKPKTEEQKQKISRTLKGRPSPTKGTTLTLEHKNKISIANKKVIHTEEWNKKVGDAQRGKPKSEEHKNKIKKALSGRKLSDKRKKQISKSQTGLVWWTNGTIDKKSKDCPGEGFYRGRHISSWCKGKTLSEETRKKISESKKGQVPWNKGIKNNKIRKE